MADTTHDEKKDDAKKDGSYRSRAGHWLNELLEGSIGALAWEGLKAIIVGFTKKTGEQVGKDTADWISIKVFGLNTEVRQRFNSVRTKLDSNDRVRLSKKLGDLTTDQSDYYCKTVMRESDDEIFAILLMHARMTDAEWARECKIQDYKLEPMQGTWQRFEIWARTDAQTGLADLIATVDEDTIRQEAILAELEQSIGTPQVTFWQRFTNWRQNRPRRQRRFLFQLRPFRIGFTSRPVS